MRESARLPKQITRTAIMTACLACLTFATLPNAGYEKSRRSHPTGRDGSSSSFARLTRSTALPDSLSLLAEPDPAARRRLSDTFGKLPLCFEANEGQAPTEARFVSAGRGYTMLLRPVEASIVLRRPTSGTDGSDVSLVRMELEGANGAARMRGLDSLPAHVNYFIGDDPSKWRTGIRTFARVRSEGVYPGVDMVYHGNQRRLEYDFVVAPGADPRQIAIRFDGAETAEIDSAGDLVLRTASGDVRHNKPVAYQEIAGVRQEIDAAFDLAPDGAVGFQLGDYDKSKELVIDPVLVYSTYLGGNNADFGRGIFVDAEGSAYVVGDSQSANFLSKASPTDSDVFVGKMHRNGFLFSYSFFGGSKNDSATGLAVDGAGNTYICGTTQSDNYPKVNSINATLSGPSDAFVTKSNIDSNMFLYSTLIGGSGDDAGAGVAIDGSGNAYLTGRTSSTDFPTVSAIQPSYGGGLSDGFVAKVGPDGSALVYSTYLGGGAAENTMAKSGIAVDVGGNAYVTGDTLSTDFPRKAPLQSAKLGATSSPDAFVSKINPAGSDFVYSTYLGGALDDSGFAIAADTAGNAYVTGVTRSPFPVPPRPTPATTAAFVAKLNPAGSVLLYATSIGGSGDESGNAIAVDSAGNVYVTGSAGAGLTTMKSIQSYFTGGNSDVFVARLASNGLINFTTYLGGSGNDVGRGIAVDPRGSIYVTGTSDSKDYLVVDPLRDENQGGTDLFISKIDPNSNPEFPTVLKVLVDEKKLFVFGQDFDQGAEVRVNDVPKGTKGGDDPTQELIAKKGARPIKPGRTVQIQVVNSDGVRSNIVLFKRPNE